MHILVVFNAFRKLILKCTSLLLKNTFKYPKFQKNFQKKIEHIKCMSFCTTADADLGLLQHLRRKKNTVMAAYSYRQLFKNAFMYEKFLNSNTTSSASIFLINFFSTRIVLYFSTRRNIFCITSMMTHSLPRFRAETNF